VMSDGSMTVAFLQMRQSIMIQAALSKTLDPIQGVHRFATSFFFSDFLRIQWLSCRLIVVVPLMLDYPVHPPHPSSISLKIAMIAFLSSSLLVQLNCIRRSLVTTFKTPNSNNIQYFTFHSFYSMSKQICFSAFKCVVEAVRLTEDPKSRRT
jgi:hypothetical protein